MSDQPMPETPLQAFRERMERERKAVEDTPTSGLSTYERAELLGRMKAYGDVVLWLYDADTKGIQQNTEMIREVLTLRENLSKFADIYMKHAKRLKPMLNRMPPLFKDLFGGYQAMIELTAGAFGIMSTSNSQGDVDKALETAQRSCDSLTKAAATVPNKFDKLQ